MAREQFRGFSLTSLMDDPALVVDVVVVAAAAAAVGLMSINA